VSPYDGLCNFALKVNSRRVIGLLFTIYYSEVEQRLFAFIFLPLNSKRPDRIYLIFIFMYSALVKCAHFKNIAEPIRVYSLEVGVPPFASLASQNRTAVLERASEALEQPDRPSIAVLPFQNMSGDPEQEYFADGMVEDIITALSRFKSLFVIARNSSFTYKGRAVDIKQIGRELGVRYVLEGSVRKAGDRVRITGQLIDSDAGTHLWADRFDGSLADVFELQDQVTTRVVAAIAPKITQAEIERARRKAAGSLDSYDLYLRGLALSHQFTPESLAEAVAVLRKAMEIDPSYATAAALSLFCFSWWHSRLRSANWKIRVNELPRTTRGAQT
jgi:adenylate cyclase